MYRCPIDSKVPQKALSKDEKAQYKTFTNTIPYRNNSAFTPKAKHFTAKVREEIRDEVKDMPLVLGLLKIGL